MKPFKVISLTTDVGTYPAGSQWRKNPVPMCGCDIGISCGTKLGEGADQLPVHEAMLAAAKAETPSFDFAAHAKDGGDPKTCAADPTCSFKIKTELPGCQICANNTAFPWSCEKCCEGCITEKAKGGQYCDCKKPGPAPGPSPRDDYTIP
jgi:hypothetical protein